MDVTATETHRLDDKVHVEFTDENGLVLLQGGRYVPDQTWDDEALRKRMIAEFADEAGKRPSPILPSAPVLKAPVVVTAAKIASELTDKAVEIQDAKDAAEAAEIAAAAAVDPGKV